MKLSILICSVPSRVSNFLPNILNKLNKQAEMFEGVEVLTFIDNKKIMLGTKRNMLVNLAIGDYVVFVDDDDDVSDDYVAKIYEATKSNADVITFTVNVSLNNEPYKPCYYSIKYDKDYNTNDAYYRLPNHIMVIKRDICKLAPYKPILKGEDSAFSKDIKPFLKNEYQLNDVLYFYNYNQQTTETQQYTVR